MPADHVDETRPATDIMAVDRSACCCTRTCWPRVGGQMGRGARARSATSRLGSQGSCYGVWADDWVTWRPRGRCLCNLRFLMSPEKEREKGYYFSILFHLSLFYFSFFARVIFSLSTPTISSRMGPHDEGPEVDD